MRRFTARQRLETAARYYVDGDPLALAELQHAAVAYRNVLQLEVTAVGVRLEDIDDRFDLGGES